MSRLGNRVPYPAVGQPSGRRRSPTVVTEAGLVKAPEIMPAEVIDAPPAIPPQRLANYQTEVVAEALDKFESVIGGRPRLVSALLAAPPSTDLDYVIGWLADPRNDVRTLSALCTEAAISLPEVLEAFKRGDGAAAFVEALAYVHAKTPEVAKDVMARALPYEAPCDRCDGAGTITRRRKDEETEITCPRCQGKRTRVVEPDLDRQQFALSLGPLAPKSAPSVVVDQRVQVADASPAGLAKLLSATDRILYGPRPVDSRPRSADTTPEVP